MENAGGGGKSGKRGMAAEEKSREKRAELDKPFLPTKYHCCHTLHRDYIFYVK